MSEAVKRTHPNHTLITPIQPRVLNTDVTNTEHRHEDGNIQAVVYNKTADLPAPPSTCRSVKYLYNF